MTYNHLNLPVTITILDENQQGGYITYVYDATGVKLFKTFTPTGINPNGIETHYAGNFIYEKSITGELTLQFFGQPEGYVVHTVATNGVETNQYVHNFTDHLGNVRISYTDLDGNGSIDMEGEIVKERNYYPFGLQHQGYNNVEFPLGSMFKYGFGGKELQEGGALKKLPAAVFSERASLSRWSIAWMDFGARNYDAELGRWFNIDPQAERFHVMSPYGAMGNNPIMYVDPDGEIVWAAVAIGAIIGAASSAAVYTATSLAKDNFSVGGLLVATLGGAIAPQAVIGGVLNNGVGGSIANAFLGGLASGFLPSANIPLGDNASLSLSPALAFGNASGIGANASLNVSTGDFISSIGVGGTFFGKAAGTGKSGFETRLSGGIGIGGRDFNVQAYSTAYLSGETSQVLGGLGLSSGDFSIRHENDFFSHNGDRYRTAALEASYRGFTAGFSLFTGDPYLDRKQFSDPNSKGEIFPGNSNPADGSLGANGSYIGQHARRYRLGAGYVGFSGLRVGVNSERIRNGIQNSLHDRIHSPRLPILSNTQSSYFQYQTYNPFSLW